MELLSTKAAMQREASESTYGFSSQHIFITFIAALEQLSSFVVVDGEFNFNFSFPSLRSQQSIWFAFVLNIRDDCLLRRHSLQF